MADQYLSQTHSLQQTQVLAPQLRQGLEFLQVPILELRALVEQELQNNPTLEELPNEMEERFDEPPSTESSEGDENGELNFEEQFEALSRLDDDFKDYFRQTQTVGSSFSEENERRQFLIDSLTRETTLQEYLTDQLQYVDLGEMDRQVAELIIGCIDDDGFLTSSPQDLAESVGMDASIFEQLLGVIQRFDPPGVGARDLRECLLLQLQRAGRGDGLEAKLVSLHLALLGGHKYQELARVMKVPLEEIDRLAQAIAALEPRPGRKFSSATTGYVLPEVFVMPSEDGGWLITTNDDHLPHLRISQHYRDLMSDPGTTGEVKRYIQEKVRAGSFMIRSIGQRQQTIANIAREIVKVQDEFLQHGVSCLKPLTMAEVADKLGIHETTVSRAVSGKYISTPQGTHEMKYFFTPGYKNSDGQSVSNKSIKDILQTLIGGESGRKPYSDQALVEMLKERGLEVARRTVAKYREELGILPSHMRKTI